MQLLPIASLLSGLGILLTGNGLSSILLGLTASSSFGEAATGIIMGGYFVGFVAGTVAVPRIIRAVGYIRTFASLAALASVAAVAHGVLIDPIAWWFLRVLSGACMAGVYMVVESWINQQTPNTHRGRVFGVYTIVSLVALGLGLALLPLVGGSGGLEPYVLASALFTLGLVPVAITPVPQPHAAISTTTDLWRLIHASPTGFAGAIVAGIVSGLLWGLGPTFWHGLGLSEAEASWYMGLMIGGGALLQWPIGHLSDGRDRRMVIGIVCAMGVAAAVFMLEAVDYGRDLLALCALVYGGLMFTVYSLSAAHVNDRVQPTDILESTRTLLLLFGCGAAFGPMIGGPIMQQFGVTAWPLLSAAFLAVLAIITVIQMWTTARVPSPDQVVFVALPRTSPVALEMLPDAAGQPIDSSTNGPFSSLETPGSLEE